MATAAIKSTAYCLAYTPELGLHHGTTPSLAAQDQDRSSFLTELPGFIPSYDETTRYAPNLTYIGSLGLHELQELPRPWHSNLVAEATRYGKYGEIMPEDEFLGLLDICDVFDVIWLEQGFVASVKEKLGRHPVIPGDVVDRMKSGHDIEAIQSEIASQGALPLYCGYQVVGCSRRGHDVDEALSARVLLENLACKAGGALALFHLLSRSGLAPEQIDFVIECSEEAAGDINQRGGGSFAKAIAECAGCTQASGFDLRAFCSGPVNALIAGGSLVASGARKNCVVLAGGALPKLFMNAREHVRKELPALESCLGSFAALLAPDDGETPVLRLDALGKHSVGAGASPQAVVTALVLDPLEKAGLKFADVDKYAGELQIAEITVPAGAGDVAEANAKMIAALAVKNGQLDRSAMGAFVAKHGVVGFAPTQGHIPSGIPFLGHAVDDIASGALKRVMIIGKGSLFLGRLTNLSDGASFLVEAPSAPAASVNLTPEDAQRILLDALTELAQSLQKDKR